MINSAGFCARYAHKGAAPRGGDGFAFLEQFGGDADLAATNEALVIFFQLTGDIQIVGGDAVGGFVAVRAQIAEGDDAFEARAVGEVKAGDRIVEAVLLTRFDEIGKRQALERCGQNIAMRVGMLEKVEEGVHRVVAFRGGVEGAGEIGEKPSEAFAREAVFVMSAAQGASKARERRKSRKSLYVGKLGGEFGHDLLDEEAAERNLTKAFEAVVDGIKDGGVRFFGQEDGRLDIEERLEISREAHGERDLDEDDRFIG